MLSAGEVEPRAPQAILGFGSALRTQGVLWRVEERRRCSGSRSFLTLLEKWTRCGVSICYSQELQNPQARKQYCTVPANGRVFRPLLCLRWAGLRVLWIRYIHARARVSLSKCIYPVPASGGISRTLSVASLCTFLARL